MNQKLADLFAARGLGNIFGISSNQGQQQQVQAKSQNVVQPQTTTNVVTPVISQ